MAKCGKGCMPECEYFTTGGCISPFNCMYKEESVYINSATSGEIFYTGGMDMTNEEMIENSKCVIADISEQCEQLKAENAELRARLECSIEFPCKVGDTIYFINPYKEQPKIDEFKVMSLCEDNFYGRMIYIDNGEFFFAKTDGLFFTRAEAEARLKKLQGGEMENADDGKPV